MSGETTYDFIYTCDKNEIMTRLEDYDMDDYDELVRAIEAATYAEKYDISEHLITNFAIGKGYNNKKDPCFFTEISLRICLYIYLERQNDKLTKLLIDNFYITINTFLNFICKNKNRHDLNFWLLIQNMKDRNINKQSLLEYCDTYGFSEAIDFIAFNWKE